MKPFIRMGRRARVRDRNRAIELGLEQFEERLLLSTIYTVNTNADDQSHTSPTVGSLPFVVSQIDAEAANTGVNTVQFRCRRASWRSTWRGLF